MNVVLSDENSIALWNCYCLSVRNLLTNYQLS